MLAAAELPPTFKLDCNRGEAGNCLPPSLSPLSELAVSDEEYAAVIYTPYWVCYWNALKRNVAFGSKNGERAAQAFTHAFVSCEEIRATADRKMDNFLRPLSAYGGEARKRFIRDSFRRFAGQDCLDARASAEGLSHQYSVMLAAYRDFAITQNGIAPNR
ncbi:MAG TPA: hypothetical protein VJQ77_10855 [Novosphingobium sp.]|nr:hypothetical protein [Novosphingobium sp.]